MSALAQIYLGVFIACIVAGIMGWREGREEQRAAQKKKETK
jgi:hypothetical protein